MVVCFNINEMKNCVNMRGASNGLSLRGIMESRRLKQETNQHTKWSHNIETAHRRSSEPAAQENVNLNWW